MNNTLTLCVICKDEENTIPKLLDSVQGDLFDQIVIVDTGSTDNTVEIVKNYPKVKLYHFKWINDFSAARNHSFSRADSDYIMWLDSDDFIKPEDYKKLLDLKNRLHESPMWLLKYEYAHDEYGNSICSFYRERIVKRTLDLKWQQPIHEYLPLVPGYTKVDIEVHHNKQETHTKRNLSILEKLVERNPNFSRNVYYLGKEYYDSGDTEKGVKLLDQYINMEDTWDENVYGALVRLSEYYLSRKDKEEAKKHLYKAIDVDPFKAKAYFYLGELSLNENDYKRAIHWYKLCIATGRSEDSLDVVEPKYHTWLPYLQMCIAYNSLGDVINAAKSNDQALSYRPLDSRMLNNKKIFIDSLKENYPYKEGEDYEYFKISYSNFDKFEGVVAWYTPYVTDYASHRIRMINISNELSNRGYRSELYNENNLSEYNYIVTGKVYSSDHINQIKHWQSLGITVICDINEDILSFMYVRETLETCDYIVCCSHDFANYLRENIKNKDVQVIEDGVEYFKES